MVFNVSLDDLIEHETELKNIECEKLINKREIANKRSFVVSIFLWMICSVYMVFMTTVFKFRDIYLIPLIIGVFIANFLFAKSFNKKEKLNKKIKFKNGFIEILYIFRWFLILGLYLLFSSLFNLWRPMLFILPIVWFGMCRLKSSEVFNRYIEKE